MKQHRRIEDCLSELEDLGLAQDTNIELEQIVYIFIVFFAVEWYLCPRMAAKSGIRESTLSIDCPQIPKFKLSLSLPLNLCFSTLDRTLIYKLEFRIVSALTIDSRF